jgi:primase-polymerase (primpol)-like protein
MVSSAGTADKPPRPKALLVQPSNIPAELKAGRQHVVWRYVLRDGKWTKPPYRPDGTLADVTDRSTWVTFPEAIAAYLAGGWDGVGRVLVREDRIVGLDADEVISEQGDLDADAAVMITLMGGYAERSPSGGGARVLARGTKPGDKCRKGKFEMYEGARYLTLTGNVLDGSPAEVPERQAGIEAVYHRIWPRAKPKPEPKPASAGGRKFVFQGFGGDCPLPLTPDELAR